MQRYFNGNQLVINVDKTQVMIIRNLSKNIKKQKQTKKRVGHMCNRVRVSCPGYCFF